MKEKLFRPLPKLNPFTGRPWVLVPYNQTKFKMDIYNKKQVEELFRKLFLQIEHGDDEHRKWLEEEIEKFIKENL